MKKLERNFVDYYQAVKGRPPRETLIKALDLFEASPTQLDKYAVDLGCGDGRDTVELVRRGWKVLAIDKEAEALTRLMARPDLDLSLIETMLGSFESLSLPESVTLVNASFCLPFCPPENFPNLWEKIFTCLANGGRFCGHLTGDRDSWALYSNMTNLTRPQVEKLLLPFEVEFFEEEEHPGVTALGEEKHWHIYNIVARKSLFRYNKSKKAN